MFQLIVAVVGIALIVILAVIAIWLGGDAFSSSGERATFTTYLNQGSQIEASLKMYKANNGVLTFEDLDGDDEVSSEEVLENLRTLTYLETIPPGDWQIDGTAIYRALEDTEQCKRLNAFMGKDLEAAAAYNGCPPCEGTEDANGVVDKTFANWPGCTRAEG